MLRSDREAEISQGFILSLAALTLPKAFMGASRKFHLCDRCSGCTTAGTQNSLTRGTHKAHQSKRASARCAGFGLRKVMPQSLCHRQQKAPSDLLLSEALEDLGFITSECGNADELGGILETQTARPCRPRRVFRRDRGRQHYRDSRQEEFRRPGSRHRSAAVGYGKGGPTNWRGIRHRDAARAADAVQRRDRCAPVWQRFCRPNRRQARQSTSPRR